MEQVIWVEILSRRRDVAARFRFTGSEVRIGRGYHNDVIVDDPYVASGHVRLFRDEVGRLVAEDIGTENGIFVDRDRTRHQRIVIDGERPIRIGRTDVRIREANHLVPRERTGRPERHTLPVVLAVALGLVNLGLEAASLWSAETVEPRVSYYLWPLLAVAMVMTTWVSIWAFLSRVLSGRAHFGRNLVIALSGLLAVLLFNELARFCAFALSWSAPVAYAYVALTAIIALVCFFHFREVSPLRLKLKGAAVATLFTLIVGAQVLKQSEAFQDSGPQITLPRLLPPALRLVPVQNENAFFAVIEQLKTKSMTTARAATSSAGEWDREPFLSHSCTARPGVPSRLHASPAGRDVDLSLKGWLGPARKNSVAGTSWPIASISTAASRSSPAARKASGERSSSGFFAPAPRWRSGIAISI